MFLPRIWRKTVIAKLARAFFVHSTKSLRFYTMLFSALWVVVLSASVLAQEGRYGIPITPNEENVFEYSDDFTTPKFLCDAFYNFNLECWANGAINNQGPHSGRILTYRFFGDWVIEDIRATIEQRANGPNLGGANHLYLSSNGLDWTLADSSSEQEPGQNSWQNKPFVLNQEKTSSFTGKNEVWLRLVLNNTSGMPTGVSNSIDSVHIRITVGDKAGASVLLDQDQQDLWGRLRQGGQWHSVDLDCTDPVNQRSPHYYEDVDGYWQAPHASAFLPGEQSDGFLIHQAYASPYRRGLSLAMFVKTVSADGPLMLQMVVAGSSDSSRRMAVSWDGQILSTFDTASYFSKDKVFFAEIPGPQTNGVHELRICGQDQKPVLLRRIRLAGNGSPAIVSKPSLPEEAKLAVLSSYYLADPAPPAASQAVEDRSLEQQAGLVHENLQKMYDEHNEFGALYIILRNEGSVPARISTLQLNDQAMEDHYVDFVKSAWDAPGVVWYRIRPQTLTPGECSQIYIRFRRRPPGDQIRVAIHLENGNPLPVTIPYQTPSLLLDYITTTTDNNHLYVYVRRNSDQTAGQLHGITLDGEPLSDVRWYGRDFPGGIALAVAQLPRPLQTMTYHMVGVHSDTNQSVAAQFRVLPFFFPRSSIHVPASLCREMNMNLAMWNPQSLETCEEFDIFTTTHTGDMFNAHRRAAYIMGPDEPDAHDNRGGGYDRGLGYHARLLAQSGWQELVQRFAPQAATWIIMNGTTRPLNWFVYGQFADISCFDPYPVTYYGADHAYVRESLEVARLSGLPKRMFACLEAYGWGQGQGVPGDARGPIPAEYRQNVVQAIGTGMKGLTSWTYAGGAGGWQINPACKEEIARLNKMIEQMETELLLATPIDLADSDAEMVPTGTVGNEKWPKPRVWVGSLLSGPDTIILTVVNHIPAGKPEPPTITPARDVTITVALPDFLRNVTACEVTENGIVPFDCSIREHQAILKMDAIESGRVFILHRVQ